MSSVTVKIELPENFLSLCDAFIERFEGATLRDDGSSPIMYIENHWLVCGNRKVWYAKQTKNVAPILKVLFTMKKVSIDDAEVLDSAEGMSMYDSPDTAVRDAIKSINGKLSELGIEDSVFENRGRKTTVNSKYMGRLIFVPLESSDHV